MATDFGKLGMIFNDATRALEGGLWKNVVQEVGQGFGSVVRYENDLKNVEAGLKAEIAAGAYSGATLNHVKSIISDIDKSLAAADASVTGGGAFGSVAKAENALRTSHLDILATVRSDHNLSALASQDGANGFLAAPAKLQGVTAAHAPHSNLAEIGAIFNDAASRLLGGANVDNKTAIIADMKAIAKDLEQLIHHEPALFGGITGIHAETLVRQAKLELQYIEEAGVSPDAGRASNDNILDMIDIVQGDANLANMANQGGISGFTPFGSALNPTPKYLDNAAQTDFWATFIAEGNRLGQAAEQLVGTHNSRAIDTLIHEFKAFEKDVTNFDTSQGGIFEARFDNELTPNSTLGAEVDAMIRGLRTGNSALVHAAAEVIHDNAADVARKQYSGYGRNI